MSAEIKGRKAGWESARNWVSTGIALVALGGRDSSGSMEVTEKELQMEHVYTAIIQNPEYGETYTAHIQKNGSGWLGQIQEVPEVQSEGSTRETLLKTLKTDLHKVLMARAEAWG